MLPKHRFEYAVKSFFLDLEWDLFLLRNKFIYRRVVIAAAIEDMLIKVWSYRGDVAQAVFFLFLLGLLYLGISARPVETIAVPVFSVPEVALDHGELITQNDAHQMALHPENVEGKSQIGLRFTSEGGLETFERQFPEEVYEDIKTFFVEPSIEPVVPGIAQSYYQHHQFEKAHLSYTYNKLPGVHEWFRIEVYDNLRYDYGNKSESLVRYEYVRIYDRVSGRLIFDLGYKDGQHGASYVTWENNGKEFEAVVPWGNPIMLSSCNLGMWGPAYLTVGEHGGVSFSHVGGSGVPLYTLAAYTCQGTFDYVVLDSSLDIPYGYYYHDMDGQEWISRVFTDQMSCTGEANCWSIETGLIQIPK